MKELYITNTETIYSGEYENPEVYVKLYGRHRDGTPDTIRVDGFDPYFYIKTDEKSRVNPTEVPDLIGYEDVGTIPISDRFADITPGQTARKLTKVTARHPGAVPKLRDRWDKTWGADVLFTNRLRIDKGIRTGVRAPGSRCDVDELEAIEMTDVAPRISFFDIETDDRGDGFPDPGDARILSIAAWDNYDKEHVCFIDTEGASVPEFFGEPDATSIAELGLEEPDRIVPAGDEKELLRKFSDWFDKCNPDIVTGWNSGDDSSDGFDLPHLIERMDTVGLNPGRLSREGEVECKDLGDDEWRVDITGRTTYDLMDGWANTKFTNPDSKRLDDVAESKLGERKIKHDGDFYELYANEPKKFVDYNVRDTRLTVEINDVENVFGFYKRLKDMIGVDWEETRENNDFVSMSVRRKCHEHGIVMLTAWDNEHVRAANANNNDGVNYEGAYVFDAFSGLKRNVVGKDLASLYPMTQAMLNASPDTKIDRMTAVKHDIPHVVAENGACFRTDVDSIIRELVDEYDEIKMEYKRKRNAAEYGTAEYEMLAVAYGTTKTIYNSYYGYTGWDKSPLYDPEIAAAITLTGQRVIKRTAEYINAETEGDVAYGDTDSNYVEYPDDWDQERILEYAQGVCDTLNDEVYPNLCREFNIDPDENRWLIELEMLATRFFQSGSKKFYAYKSMWSEGMDFDEKVNDGEGKISISGYACKKSNFSKLTKETQEAVLKTILNDGSKQDVADIMFEAANKIDPTDPDWDAIGMPQGLGQNINPEKSELDGYYSWSTSGNYPKNAHPRGAWFANHLLDVKISKGDQPKRVYLQPSLSVEGELVDVICFNDASDLKKLDGKLKVDMGQNGNDMQEKVLVNPMEDILEAFGMEMSAALCGRAETQSTLGGFA